MAYLKYILKDEEVFGSDSLFREIAEKLFKQEQYVNSLKYFDEAILQNPNDVKSLLQRSECRARLCLFDAALRDIEYASSLFPNKMEIIVQRAFISYLSCEFEESILEIAKLIPTERFDDRFQKETMHCYDAIINCISEPAGNPLRDHYKIIKKLAWMKNMAELSGETAKKKKKPSPFFKVDDQGAPHITEKAEKPSPISKEVLDSFHVPFRQFKITKSAYGPFPFRPLQSYTTNLEKYMGEKYLENLVKDKCFLKNLPNIRGINCPNQKSSKKIREIAKKTYKTISHQQEVLRARRPFYFIKNKEALAENNESVKLEQIYVQRSTLREAELMFAKVKKAEACADYKAVLHLIEKFHFFCDSKPKRLLPNKQIYVREIAQIMCDLFYKMKRINPNQYAWDQVKRIQVSLGLPVSREPSCDSVIGNMKQVFIDANKKIQLFEKRLKGSEDSNEICWYLFELCRYNIDLRNIENARFYGKKCIIQGKETKNLHWVINCCILVAKVCVMQKNKFDAKNHIKIAQEVADELKDKTLIEYLGRCQEVLDHLEFDEPSGQRMLEQRQKNILEMLTCSRLKNEFSNLFRAMATLPTNRTMSIIPGIKTKEPDDQKRKFTRFSVFPGNKKEASAKFDLSINIDR